MKVYIAASYPRKEDALILSVSLEAEGHYIVSSWMFKDEGYSSDDRDETQEQKFDRLQAAAIRDFKEVKDCDMLVCLTDGEKQLTCGGRHTELGIALALEKRVVIIGPLEQVFHYYRLHRYVTVGEFLENFGT